MRAGFACLLVAALASACAHDVGRAQSLDQLHVMHDWASGDGKGLEAAYKADIQSLLVPQKRAGALSALQAAGYECVFGEAHEDYPEPAAQCTYSFATRACQMDWEVFLTSEPAVPGGIETLDAGFTRDCVGVDRDWPVAVKSPIDDQLAGPRP